MREQRIAIPELALIASTRSMLGEHSDAMDIEPGAFEGSYAASSSLGASAPSAPYAR